MIDLMKESVKGYFLLNAAASRDFDPCTGLPGRLRDIGIQESDLHDLALQGMANRTVAQNPRPITEAELETLLRQAW